MIRSILFTGILAFLALLIVGCNGNSNTPPIQPSNDDIYELRIGNTVIEKGKPSIVALGMENTMKFQFLKKFNPVTFQNSIMIKMDIVDITQGWSYTFTTTDIQNNGTVAFANNDFGSVVSYLGFNPLDHLELPASFGSQAQYVAAPGDELGISVIFLTAEFEDSSRTLFRGDQLQIFYSSDIFTRQVGTDDLDTGGAIESIKIGETLITDQDVNIIRLDNTQEITVDFNTQLNPYKFKDLLDFRIVLNNLSTHQSYIIERSSLDENGELYVVDYVRGIVKYRMNHTMDKVTIGGVDFYPAFPGDLIEVRIDYFNDEDLLENSLKWQNKKFRILFVS